MPFKATEYVLGTFLTCSGLAGGQTLNWGGRRHSNKDTVPADLGLHLIFLQ